VMCLALHPYIVGQPQFIGTVRAMLDDLAARDGVWFATASDIAEHYLQPVTTSSWSSRCGTAATDGMEMSDVNC